MEQFEKPVRVMLVDDHAMVRDGVRVILESLGDYVVVAQAADGRDAVDRISESPVDIVVMDVAMPGMDGITATRLLHQRDPKSRIVMLSMHTSAAHVRAAREAGAAAYCAKQAGGAELVTALARVREGGNYVTTQAEPAREHSGGLTPRQTQILELVALSNTSKDIARRLGISVKTVESHRTALMRHLGVHDLAALVRFAIKTGLIRADQPAGASAPSLHQVAPAA